MRRYPQPGTMADRILDFIAKNPGVSTNRIITKLELNPSPARTCLRALVKYDKLVDEIDGNGHHAYRAKTSL